MKSIIPTNIRRSCDLITLSLIWILPVLPLLFILAASPDPAAYAQRDAQKNADPTDQRSGQWRLAQNVKKVKQNTFSFDRGNEDMTEDDVRSMLLKNNFYASCWTYNREFCHPDGDFENAFVDNGDGTVTDNATGLMWQKGGSPAAMTWEDAGRYVQQMNQKGFGGYSDWRLPKLIELASIMECSWKNGDLFLDVIFDRNQISCWSASTRGADRAWKINFRLGYVIDSPVKSQNAVKAVRLKSKLWK